MLKNMGQMLAAMAAANIARPIIVGYPAPPPARLGGNRKHHKKIPQQGAMEGRNRTQDRVSALF